jgi:hypothetical protein
MAREVGEITERYRHGIDCCAGIMTASPADPGPGRDHRPLEYLN